MKARPKLLESRGDTSLWRVDMFTYRLVVESFYGYIAYTLDTYTGILCLEHKYFSREWHRCCRTRRVDGVRSIEGFERIVRELMREGSARNYNDTQT
ncbi:MAG: hypothetical protein ACP5N5_06255 [Desulfurococcus sp.]|uniref:hypothetical protein n=1 Tax=Desulfurococcus sp. TaxID=51678 RepID=UPI003D14F3D0